MVPLSEGSTLAGPRAASPAPASAHDAEPTAGRILVAEDNPVNATVAVKMLEKRGYRADLARDGRQAVEMLGASRYDAVLMDCQMPELDGYEAAREIRRREAGSVRTPVIAMTAHSMTGDREKCLAAGMDDYLAKPIRSELLHDALRRWVPQRPAVTSPPSPDASEVEGPEDHVPLVDRSILGDLLAAGSEVASSIVELFVGEAGSLVAALGAEAAAGDAAAVAERAHLLKGGSASVGAARVAALAGRIEDLARAGALAEVPGLIEVLAAVLEPSIAALRTSLDTEASGNPAA